MISHAGWFVEAAAPRGNAVQLTLRSRNRSAEAECPFCQN